MDTFARALLTAQAILDDGEYLQIKKSRYSSFDSKDGKKFEQGKLKLEDLRILAERNGEPIKISGRQEYMENLVNRFI